MNTNILLTGLILLALVTPYTLASTSTQSSGLGSYDGPGTIVVGTDNTGPIPRLVLVDNGAVVCTDTDYAGGNAAGRGGVCIPFGDMKGDSILIDDQTHGTDVAFQVCVDVSGDGICTANERNAGNCGDRVLFSHESRFGQFFNPLYIPPTMASSFVGCESDGYPGYIVILCAGAHRDAGDAAAHTHDVTSGTVTDVTTGGTESGDFCGGPTAEKAYVVV